MEATWTHFEQVVSEIFWREGYWVPTSFKVELSKKEKQAIGRPSSPRWELDVIAYNARNNILKVIECKSYIDSRGVAIRAFDGSNEGFAKRFKLFGDKQLRNVVFSRLRKQFTESGACRKNPKVKLRLACGRIATEADRKKEVVVRAAVNANNDLTISDGISTIVARTIFLDSLLAALIFGYNRSSTTNRVVVGISEEPQPLLIETTPEGLLSISYENQRLTPQPRPDLRVALLGAAQYLLRELASFPDSQRNAFSGPNQGIRRDPIKWRTACPRLLHEIP